MLVSFVSLWGIELSARFSFALQFLDFKSGRFYGAVEGAAVSVLAVES